MGAAHGRGGVRAESFGVDGFVRGFSFDAEPFVSLRLALGAAPAHIGSSQITRRVGVAAALTLGLVGHDSFRIPIDVCLLLGSGTGVATPSSTARLFLVLAWRWMFFLGCHFARLDSPERAAFIANHFRRIQRIHSRILLSARTG